MGGGGYQAGGGSVMSVGLSFEVEADVWIEFGAQEAWLREGACACNTGGCWVAIEEHACTGLAEHRRLPDGGCRVQWCVCCMLFVGAILRLAFVYSQQQLRREGAFAGSAEHRWLPNGN